MDPSDRSEGMADLLIEDGRIRMVKNRGYRIRGKYSPPEIRPYIKAGGEELKEYCADRVIDASGCIVAPGLMDAHVHFRDPGFTWKEDLITGSKAAAKGGFCCVVNMANTNPVIDEPSALRAVLERSREAGVRILQASSVTKGLKGRELVDMEEMASSGAACFSDDGIPVLDERLLREAMERAKKLSLPVSLHEEHPMFIKGAGVHHGEISKLLGYGGAYAEAEEIMVARDCVLALHTGAKVCIQHISSGKSVEIVRMAKQWGADVHAEATPHHFSLTEQDVLKYGTNAKMNPPLRTRFDQRAVIEGLRDGTIDMIVTDHAPHSASEKAQPMEKAPSGIIGLETSLSLGLKNLVLPGHISLMRLIELMSTSPAAFYGVHKSRIREGEPADLVIFSDHEKWTADHFVSKSSNSPFLGWELPGVVRQTICGGRIIYEHESGTADRL